MVNPKSVIGNLKPRKDVLTETFRNRTLEAMYSKAEKTGKPGRLYIENLGCAKNQVDAEVMAKSLSDDGWILTEEASYADLIIVNTCGFIESAREESINTFFELKDANPKARIILSGCMAQRYGKELKEQLHEADGIFGNRNLSLINGFVSALTRCDVNGPAGTANPNSPDGTPGLAGHKSRTCVNASTSALTSAVTATLTSASTSAVTATLTSNKKKTRDKAPELLVPEYPDPDSEIYERERFFNFPGSAYLKISEGCNHRCGYCAIPIIRGSLRSRPKATLLKEAKELVAKGIREINLIAQDLAAYGCDIDGKSHFIELLSDLAAIEGDFRIRMLYIHPDAFPPELADFVKANPKVMPYFDIPFQHASKRILRPMKRAGDIKTYTELVSSIRKTIPECVIRTTIMLGFPGEEDSDFDTVYDFVKTNRFNWLGSFLYSSEEETFAYDLTDEEACKQMTKIAKKRQKKLEKLQEKISSERLKEFVGKEYDVLIEELIEGEELAIGSGRSYGCNGTRHDSRQRLPLRNNKGQRR